MIEFIREKCIEANPEIVEPAMRKGMLCLVSDHGERYVTSYDVAVAKSTVGDYEILQVLPRPIRLADVLLAIEKVKDQTQHGKCVMILCNGWGEKERWDLRQDNLNDQDEPTIRFIYELLK